MTRWFLTGLVLLLGCLGGLPDAQAGARPEAFDIRSKGGSLGQLPRVVVDDGGAYVSAERLAAVLRGTWTVKGSRGTLIANTRTAEFTRSQSKVVIQGQPLELEAPARVGAAGWLIPEDFLSKGLPRLVPGTTALGVGPESRKAGPKTVQAPVALEELRYRSYPSFTRVVVETGGTLAYAVVAGSQEVRVRLPGLALVGARSETLGDGLIRELKLEPIAGGAVLRVLLEGPAAEVKDSVLQDPFRLVLDIYRPREPAEGGGPQTVLQPLRLIVLDAGHGGHDPGAIGPTGLAEKDVVLDVTKRVARLVEEGLGVKVAFTRTTDAFLPLRDRTNFANKQRADLFVSIHANAHPRAVSEGVETYFLSSEASDNEARQVAAIENGVVQLEGPASRDKGDILKTILWDLAQSEFQQESSSLAETVQDSMTRSLNLVNRGVKQAGFYVLGGAAMPAILVEVGFLTNRKEERKLATSEHRQAVARAIYAGLAEYKRRWDQRMRTVQTVPVRSESPR